MFPPKTSADVRMVQCVPARYGKTTWQKNLWNKEEGQYMQIGGPASPCNKEDRGPIHAKTRSLTCVLTLNIYIDT